MACCIQARSSDPGSRFAASKKSRELSCDSFFLGARESLMQSKGDSDGEERARRQHRKQKAHIRAEGSELQAVVIAKQRARIMQKRAAPDKLSLDAQAHQD